MLRSAISSSTASRAKWNCEMALSTVQTNIFRASARLRLKPACPINVDRRMTFGKSGGHIFPRSSKWQYFGIMEPNLCDRERPRKLAQHGRRQFGDQNNLARSRANKFPNPFRLAILVHAIDTHEDYAPRMSNILAFSISSMQFGHRTIQRF
jgi:hypothetical protein